VEYPQFSVDGLPITYVPDPFKADGVPTDGQWKEPVRVHSTGVITLSGLQTVDGVSVMEGDRVLVKDQVDPAQNGIYVASATSWRRAPDMYLWPQFVGAVVAVSEGISVGDTVWICQVASTGTVGVTPNYWISVSQVAGTLPTFTPLRAIVSDVAGTPAASSTTAQEIAFVSGVTSAVQQQFNFLYNEAGAAYTIAIAGTNAASNAQSTANNAQGAAATAQSTASSAYGIAVAGTNAAATAQSTASSAYAIAVTGTIIGSLAYTTAVALGDKYVRTTRFATIGAGTSGTVALPSNSTIVLDDFGGTTDAVVTGLSGGRPTASHVFTAAGAIVSTTFDLVGNYALSGAPNAYPVALVYRVRQKLSDFDSLSTDIIGSYDVEALDSVTGTPNQVLVNGTTGAPQYGGVILTLPQSIAPTSSPTFAGLTSTGSVYTGYVDFNTVNAGTVPRATGRLWWDNVAQTLQIGMAGTAVTQQIGEEFLIHGYNSTAGIIGNGHVVYITGATGTYPTLALASAAVRSQSRGVVGLATEDILPSGFGYVTSQGIVNGIDTATLTQGRPVYLDTVAGGLTLTPPPPPYSTVFIGIVVRQNGSTGAIYVDLRPSGALSELQDVSIPAPLAGQRLIYNGSVWTAAYASGEVSHTSFSYYLNGTYPEFPGYELLTTEPTGGTEVIETVSVTSAGSVLIDQYISGTFGRTQLDAGEWLYETYASANKKDNYLQVKTYVLSGTTETSLWSFTTTEIPTAVGPVPQTIYGTVTPVSLTDRLLVRYYAGRTGPGSANVSLYHNGNAHYTHIDTPFPAFHNSLAGLQGGDGSDQFFHLSGTQYSQFDATVSTAAAAQSTANSAWALAQIGTNTGTAAYNLASAAYNLASANSPLFTLLSASTGTILPASPTNLVILADSSGGQVVVALPVATNWVGRIIHVKKTTTDGNTVILRSVNGSNTVDSTLNWSFTTPFTSVQVTTNGTNWYIL